MAQITYDDKVALNVNSDIADINKCNASDMNEIKNTINGINDGTDVVDNLVVGSIQTKNIFGNYTIINGYIYGTLMRTRSDYADRLAFIECKPNTTYTISRSVITSSFRVSDYTSIPPVSSTNTDITIPLTIENNSGTTITYTTSASAKYLIVMYGNITNDSNINDSLATIQVEKGNTATAYTPFQDLNPDTNNIKTRLGIPSTSSDKYRGLYIKSNKTNTNTFVFDVPEFIETNGTIRNIICVLGDIGMFSAYYTQAGSTQILGTSFRTSTTVSLSYSNGQITITSSNTAYGGCTVLFIN